MRINGFQKLTLLDFPGKTACTIFTAGCNLRCPFCHNAELVTSIDLTQSYEQSDILDYINMRKNLLDGVCISGGEPLIYDDTLDFMKRIKDIGLAVKLDTNGFYPQRLKKAIDDGLVDYVATDIKNSKEKYPLTTGIAELDITPIEQSVELLMSGTVDYEFRTTVVAELHTKEDMHSIGKWIAGAKRYFLQGFVDSGKLIKEGMHAHDKEYMNQLADIASEYIALVSLRGIQ